MQHTLPNFQVNSPKFFYLNETISLKKGDEVIIRYKKEGKGRVYFANKTQLFDELSVVIPVDDFYTMAGYSLSLDGMLVRDISIEVSTKEVNLFRPYYDEDYHTPDFDYGCMNENWCDMDSDEVRYKKGLVFQEKKHAIWVSKYNMNPLILNAALAVDGLSSIQHMREGDSWIIVVEESIENNVKDIKLIEWISLSINKSFVYFETKQKAEEALEVMHCGKTIREWLEC